MVQPPWEGVIEGVVINFEGTPLGPNLKIKWQTIGPDRSPERIQPGWGGTKSLNSDDVVLNDADGKFRVTIPNYLCLSHPYLFTALDQSDKVIGQAIIDIPVAGVDGHEVYQILIIKSALIEIRKGQLKSTSEECWWYGQPLDITNTISLLQEIKEIIQNRLEYDAVKEKAFDKLYEEMRRQKEASDLLDRAVKPVLSDLLLLYDSMKNFESSFINNHSLSSEDAKQNFKYIMDELMEILYRQEVTPIDENLSEVFNSKLQKATKTENAESKEDDFKIVGIVRSGFVWRDKVLRPQEVVIKRFLNRP